MPQQGWHANISFAEPATEMVCEVILRCGKFTPESNAKYSFRQSNARSPLDGAVTPLRRFSARLAAAVCKTPPDARTYKVCTSIQIHTEEASKIWRHGISPRGPQRHLVLK